MTAGRDGRDVLWSATLGAAPLDVRIDAAIDNGFRGLTIRPEDVDAMRASGADPMVSFQRARDGGIERFLTEADSSWYSHQPAPAWFTSAAFGIDDHLRLAELSGAEDVTVVAPLPTTDTIEQLTEAFAAVCDRCSGLRVHLEFTPLPPIGSLALAWQIVRDADRDNGGILFDTWHFFRGQPNLDLLATIPGHRIFSVQLNDGDSGLHESLVKDTYRHRKLPGAGHFDLDGVLAVLVEIGGLQIVGPEVLSIELESRAPVEAARLAGDAAAAVLTRAQALAARTSP